MTDLRAALHEIASEAPTLDQVRGRFRPTGRRWAPVLAAASVIVVATATAVTIAVTGGGGTASTGSPPSAAAPTEPWYAVCFGESDLSTALRSDQGMAQKAGAVNTAPRPEDWIDVCASHWLGDTFTVDSVVNPDGSVPAAPPGLHLVACVLPDGTYGIFRGATSTCADLGLAVAVAPDPGVGVLDESDEPTG